VIERNTEFDPLAGTYNRCWGAEYHAQAFPVLQHLLLSKLKPGANVLDVCCGTGQFTRRVRDAGFRLTGIDASAEMLRYACENVPDVEFHVADVREFFFNHRFAGAYSVFESLNHVPDLEGLSSAFRCIHSHLQPGAPFLFDLNGEEAFSLFWNDTSAIVEPDRVCVLRSEYNEDSRRAKCAITLFEQNPEWQRKDFVLQQTCHRLEDVQAALKQAGFANVTFFDAEDAGMSEHTGYHRTFVLAQA
jgi:ubiquinone/menaquinone biosynthesis C-methylase UbiE